MGPQRALRLMADPGGANRGWRCRLHGGVADCVGTPIPHQVTQADFKKVVAREPTALAQPLGESAPPGSSRPAAVISVLSVRE